MYVGYVCMYVCMITYFTTSIEMNLHRSCHNIIRGKITRITRFQVFYLKY